MTAGATSTTTTTMTSRRRRRSTNRYSSVRWVAPAAATRPTSSDAAAHITHHPLTLTHSLTASRLHVPGRHVSICTTTTSRRPARTARTTRGAGSTKRYGVRPSVCLSVPAWAQQQQQTRCCRFAAVSPASRRYRSITAAAAGECGQCHVVSVSR